MTRSRWSALVLLAALPAAGSTIVPPLPGAQQPVDLRLTVDSCTFNPDTVVVAASCTTLRVTQRLNNCFAPGTPKVCDVRLGNFPVGDYRVEVYNTSPASGTPAETLSFHVASAAELDINLPSPRPLTNYSGFWWNPEVPGIGMALAQTPGGEALFGAVYRYDGTTQLPIWYTVEGGHWTSPTTWQGTYIRNVGPAGNVTSTPLGSAILDFSALSGGGRLVLSTTTFAMVTINETWVRFVP